MSNGLPKTAKVGLPGQSVSIDPATYFLAKRMEAMGVLRRGHALMLAATLPKSPKPRKGAKK